MGTVLLNKTYQVCATCAFWSGPREILGEDISFNNRDNGICGGASFTGWRMGAISTCTCWELWREPRNRNETYNPPVVNNLTL